MNIITVAGHLGADPESRMTANGQKVTTLILATNVRRNKKDETIWWRITIWGEQFDKMLPFLKKGSPVVVVGDLHKPEVYTDKNGNPQVSMNLTASNIMFSPFGQKDKSQNLNTSEQTMNSDNQFAGFATGAKPNTEVPENKDSFDDEIPF